MARRMSRGRGAPAGLRHNRIMQESFQAPGGRGSATLPGGAPGLAALAAVAALAGMPHAAQGQIIDQYLNTDIPGYGADPSVTVASRSHPEYDATGVRVGVFDFTATLNEAFGYDGNVTGTPDAHGSPLIETNANLGAAADWGDTRANASLMVDDFEYPSESGQSYTNWSAAIGASHDVGQDTLYVGATHLNLNQTPRDLDVPSLAQSLAYRVDDLRATYKIDLGRAYLLPGIDLSAYNFDNGFADGLRYVQSYRDRFVASPSLEGDYQLAERRRIVVVLRDTQSNFAHTQPGVARETYNDFSILAGLAYDADGIIGFRILVGYEQRNFSSAAYKTIQAPIVEGSVTWTPTGLTTITGTLARYIEDSAAEATVGYTETAFKLTVDHELYRNIILNGHAAVYIDDYSGGGGNQEYYTAGGGVTWRLNRHLSLGADYTFAARQASSTVPAAFEPDEEIFGANYTDNVFMLRLKAAL